MSSWMTPPDPPEDPRDDSERWEEAFKLMEDERAEFEAIFRDLNYDMTRQTIKNVVELPECDYVKSNTGAAWTGWLMAARVSWVPTP